MCAKTESQKKVDALQNLRGTRVHAKTFGAIQKYGAAMCVVGFDYFVRSSTRTNISVTSAQTDTTQTLLWKAMENILQSTCCIYCFMVTFWVKIGFKKHYLLELFGGT